MGVIDRATFARVLAAEPCLPFAPEVLSRNILDTLSREMEHPTCAEVIQTGQGEAWSMAVKDLARLLGNEISPAQAGRMVRRLGLRSERFRDGFHFFWNRDQWNILREIVK